jgi:DNA-binding transcriptional MerR regulator
MAEFDLRTLCGKADVTPRTVHFYVQQGLLPPASSPGPGAKYHEGHVSRLRLIRLLQKQHLPLAEIAKRLKPLTDAQVDTLLAETKAQRAAPHGSALDYIRDVLASSQVSQGLIAKRSPDARMQLSLPGSPASKARVGAVEPAETSVPFASRSQWERFVLGDGIELHVQRPLTRVQQRQLDRLMTAARGIFEEEP